MKNTLPKLKSAAKWCSSKLRSACIALAIFGLWTPYNAYAETPEKRGFTELILDMTKLSELVGKLGLSSGSVIGIFMVIGGAITFTVANQNGSQKTKSGAAIVCLMGFFLAAIDATIGLGTEEITEKTPEYRAFTQE